MSEEKAKKQHKGNDAAGSGADPIAKPNYTQKKTKQPWTMARCKKFARRFHNASEWLVGAPSSYKAAEARGWLKECSALFKKDGDTSKSKKMKKSA